MSSHIALRPTSLHDVEALWNLEDAINLQLARRQPRGSAIASEVLCFPKRGKARDYEGIEDTQREQQPQHHSAS